MITGTSSFKDREHHPNSLLQERVELQVNLDLLITIVLCDEWSWVNWFDITMVFDIVEREDLHQKKIRIIL